jgi:hypothetical protein
VLVLVGLEQGKALRANSVPVTSHYQAKARTPLMVRTYTCPFLRIWHDETLGDNIEDEKNALQKYC